MVKIRIMEIVCICLLLLISILHGCASGQKKSAGRGSADYDFSETELSRRGSNPPKKRDALRSRSEVEQRSLMETRRQNELLKRRNASLRDKIESLKYTTRQAVRASTEKAASEILYRRAFYYFHNLNYEGSRKMFTAFLEVFPGHELRGNARYWIGECLYMRKEYLKACDAFLSVMEKHPGSRKCPDSLFKLGLCFRRLGDVDKAVQCWKSVIKRWPKTRAAYLSGKFLARLRRSSTVSD